MNPKPPATPAHTSELTVVFKTEGLAIAHKAATEHELSGMVVVLATRSDGLQVVARLPKDKRKKLARASELEVGYCRFGRQPVWVSQWRAFNATRAAELLGKAVADAFAQADAVTATKGSS